MDRQMRINDRQSGLDGCVYFKTEKLTVGYNGRAVVRDIDIELEKGRILTLIGPNGSGKSTILKSIARQLEKLSGCVYLGREMEPDSGWRQGLQRDGRAALLRDMDELSNKEFAKSLAVVLTEKVSTELLTCGDIAAMGRYPYTGRLGVLSAEDRNKVCEALETVGLGGLYDTDFMSLSDGQKQRVLIARAICQEPEVMVLDEPTSYLDIRHKLALLKILRRLAAEQGTTVIMSLHELELAQRVSDRVLCVKGEYVEKYGTPEEVLNSEFVGELYDLDNGRYSEIFGSVEMNGPASEPEVFVIAGGGTGAPVFRSLQRNGVPFSTGVLHENDVDYELARTMAVKVISERPFFCISDAAYRKALAEMERCGQAICAVNEFGDMNEKNRLLADEARRMGILRGNV